MELYKKSQASAPWRNITTCQEELEDRYGDLPKSVQLLLEVVLVKAEAHEMGIRAISQKHGNLLLEFQPQPNIDPQKLMQLLAKEKGKYLFTAGANPYLTIKPSRGEGEKPLELIKKCFEALKD